MASRKILVVVGSSRDGRQGIKVAKMILNQLQQTQGVEPSLLDPLELETPMMKQPLHFMQDQSVAPEWMKETKQRIEEAAGFVVVSPEYNAGVSPALANLLNHFAPAIYRHKPVSIATYSMGSFGGIRCQFALRPYLSELGLVSLPSVICLPLVHKAEITDEGICNDERINNNVTKVCKEIAWYSSALLAHKSASGDAYPN